MLFRSVKGGAHAAGLAQKYGVDLSEFANMIEPGQAQQGMDQAFGNLPTDEMAGKPGFKSMDKAKGDLKQKRVMAGIDAKNKKAEQRRAMGGFLMDVGLRILASNRPTAAGAFGEGVLGAQQVRRDRSRQDAADKMVTEDRERKARREDESDTMARQREMRAQEKHASSEKRMEDKAEADGLVKIVKDDGTIEFVPIKEGPVLGKDGAELRQATSADISAAQARIDERAISSAYDRAKVRLDKLLEQRGVSAEVTAIKKEKDPEKRKVLRQAWLDEELRTSGYRIPQTEQTVDYLDY